jgi:hypothetical protein
VVPCNLDWWPSHYGRDNPGSGPISPSHSCLHCARRRRGVNVLDDQVSRLPSRRRPGQVDHRIWRKTATHIENRRA